MKYYKLIFFLVLLPFLSAAQEIADAVRILDTRNLNDLPEVYKRILKAEFKIRDVISAPGSGTYSTLMTIAPWVDGSGNKTYQLTFNDGGIFYRNALFTDRAWGGWRRLLVENSAGNVGIGTTDPTEKLSVNGNIRAKEIKVEATNWPDYVFENDYPITPLNEVEAFVIANKHLPGIPNGDRIAEEGISLGEMNKKLLEKIEELTLYIIDLKKSSIAHGEAIEALKRGFGN